MYYSTFQCPCQQLSAFIFVVFLQHLSTHCLLTSLYCKAFQLYCQPLLDILRVVFLQHIDVCVFADMILLYFYLVSLSRPLAISGQNEGLFDYNRQDGLVIFYSNAFNECFPFFSILHGIKFY